MSDADWLSSQEACAQLGVRPQTLYAYVSRGRLRMQPAPDDPRRSLYRASDLAALVERKRRSRRPADVAAGAISFGEPVLESAISTVVDGRLIYRGRDAIALAERETLEAVATLLRGGPAPALVEARSAPPRLPTVRERVLHALAARAAVDPPALGRGPAALAGDAAALLGLVADAVAGAWFEGPAHARLAQAWGLPVLGGEADLIRRLLVLTADHELNASAFAARVTAATGASLAASMLAGLATLTGPRHGGATQACRTLAAEAARLGGRAAVETRLLEDRALPGFGHTLYPAGDPRAGSLLARFEPPAPLAELARAVAEVAGEAPNIDFALLAACEALGLPEDAPFALFVVARSAGWTAHAIEQVQQGGLIRPRARYVGPLPD